MTKKDKIKKNATKSLTKTIIFLILILIEPTWHLVGNYGIY